jgi:hypothetical protein
LIIYLISFSQNFSRKGAKKIAFNAIQDAKKTFTALHGVFHAKPQRIRLCAFAFFAPLREMRGNKCIAILTAPGKVPHENHDKHSSPAADSLHGWQIVHRQGHYPNCHHGLYGPLR